MSQYAYLLAVFPGEQDLDAVAAVLAAATGGRTEGGGRWEHVRTGSSGSVGRSALGFTIAHTAIPGGGFLDEERKEAWGEFVEAFLRGALDGGAILSWLTRYDTLADGEFVEGRVLPAILLESAIDAGFQAVAVGASHERLLDPAPWVLWWRGAAGAVYGETAARSAWPGA